MLPPRGPDGMIPAGPPRSLPVIHAPSLCDAGPCRNFHRVESLMDAQGPLDGSGDAVHPQVTRACYPAPGIEVELGETPILRCSRWEPDNEQGRLDGIRDQFLKTPPGKAFAEQMINFEEAIENDREQDHADMLAANDPNNVLDEAYADDGTVQL